MDIRTIVLVHAASIAIAAAITAFASSSWSQGLSTVVAFRVGREHALAGRFAKAASNAAVAVLLRDLFVLVWCIDVCVDLRSLGGTLCMMTKERTKKTKKKQKRPPTPPPLAVVAWRVVTVVSRHVASLTHNFDLPFNPSFWKTTVAARIVRGSYLNPNPFVCAARCLFVSLLVRAILLVRVGSFLRRWALIVFIVVKFVRLRRRRR